MHDGMTTFDDLFTDTFRAVDAPRRRSRLLGTLVLLAAALLVIGALLWVRQAVAMPERAPIDPVSLLPVLAEPQTAADEIASDDLADLSVTADSTRFLVATPTARYYAATSPTHLLCVVAIPAGDLPEASCTSTAVAATMTIDDEVALVPVGATAPEGWRQVAPNVYTKN